MVKISLNALALVVLHARMAGAMVATPVEIDRAAAWIGQYFAQEPGRPRAFSFLLDGATSEQSLAGWRQTCSQETAEPGKTRYLLVLADPDSGLECVYTALFYRTHAMVELLLEVRNAGSRDSPLLERILPLDCCFPMPQWPCTLHHALGDSNSERSFMPLANALEPESAESITLAPSGGRSSDGHMPFFNLQWKGGGMVVAIGWAGQWEARFECEPDRRLRVSSGMQHTRLRLHPGEEIRAPRVLLQFWQGEEDLRGNNLFRQWMLEHNLPKRNGETVLTPICGTVAEIDPDGSYEGPHIRVMKPLAERGIEVFWSDMDPQQWYPIGFPHGTGTWEPDPVKYPRGLRPIGEAARSAGLGYLLWFEPERVASDTRIEKLHPEWIARGDPFHLFRLDLPEARAWLTDTIDVQIAEAGLNWIRWDFNMAPLEYWRKNDAPEREGITEIRHIEGLYAMWEDLMRRHPGLVVDLCASGGRRIDFETLRYGLPLWHSDLQCFGPHPAADQLQNGGLFRWVPLHGCGVFGLEPSYLFRSGMTTGNILCLNAYGPENEEGVGRSVALYKKVRPYMLGDFYPLFPHSADESVWYGFQFHRPDFDAGFALIFRRKDSPYVQAILNLNGIEDEKQYVVTYEDLKKEQAVSGRDLRSFPVEIPSAGESIIVYYRGS